MQTNRRRTITMGLGGLAALGLPGAGRAQSKYPDRPIRLIVPFATGGGSDFIGRFIAHRLTEPLQQQVIVDNKPGAGGTLGIEQMVHSANDGYTLGLIASSYTVSPSLYKFKFDPVEDITPIVQLSQGPMVAVVTPSFPARSIKELIDYAKKNPAQINFASAGQGSVTHMAAEYFADMAGIKMTHVPYKGTGPALTDTMAGQTQLFFSSTATTLPHVQSGKLRALGVTTDKRIPALPDVPTIAEAGVPGYACILWHGLIGPKNLPAPIVERINHEAVKALGLADAIEKLQQDGVSPAGGSPAQFKATIEKEIPLWAKLVEKAGVKVS
ncbi:MAG: tripartite tricarboxylate transporter substrate binding protein [Burkholderiaceae bacterium]